MCYQAHWVIKYRERKHFINQLSTFPTLPILGLPNKVFNDYQMGIMIQNPDRPNKFNRMSNT